MTTSVRERVAQLCQQSWVLGALAVAAERGLLARLAAGPMTLDELARAGGLLSIATLVRVGFAEPRAMPGPPGMTPILARRAS
jgi:hypothetical protein